MNLAGNTSRRAQLGGVVGKHPTAPPRGCSTPADVRSDADEWAGVRSV